jgi:pyruvate formate lyase activating enzyme
MIQLVRIHAIQKTTLQDFPNKVACIVFLAGCNFRCIYCHNPAAVKGQANLSEEEFFSFLKERKGKLQGVVVSGGEPTIYPDLFDFISRIKQMGFSVKLDTNGARPEIVKRLLKAGFLDYLAMDMKAPYRLYPQIANAKGFAQKLRKSVRLIMNSGVDYEFRTTCHPSLSRKDFLELSKQIKGAKRLYLQQYVDEVTLNPQKHLAVYNNKALSSLKEDLKDYFDEIGVR